MLPPDRDENLSLVVDQCQFGTRILVGIASNGANAAMQKRA